LSLHNVEQHVGRSTVDVGRRYLSHVTIVALIPFSCVYIFCLCDVVTSMERSRMMRNSEELVGSILNRLVSGSHRVLFHIKVVLRDLHSTRDLFFPHHGVIESF
jgi:hypothetical protein